MKNEASKIETRGVSETRGDPGTGLSRRTFIKGVSAVGAGTLVVNGAGSQAGAQYGPSSVDGLSTEQLTTMYTDMLRIRFWESKVKDLILARWLSWCRAPLCRRRGHRRRGLPRLTKGRLHRQHTPRARSFDRQGGRPREDAGGDPAQGHWLLQGLRRLPAHHGHESGDPGHERDRGSVASSRGRGSLWYQGQGNRSGRREFRWRRLHSGSVLHQRCQRRRDLATALDQRDREQRLSDLGARHGRLRHRGSRSSGRWLRHRGTRRRRQRRAECLQRGQARRPEGSPSAAGRP